MEDEMKLLEELISDRASEIIYLEERVKNICDISPKTVKITRIKIQHLQKEFKLLNNIQSHLEDTL